MGYIFRILEEKLHHALKRQKSVLLLGARQTGKTTLVSRLKSDLTLSFIRPDIRLRYEKNPALLAGEVEALKSKADGPPLIILDEVQKVPEILDVVQDLIDRGKGLFVLTGSSARKLRRRSETNLLPGRVVSLKLDPFICREQPGASLEERLLYGSLPGIASVPMLQDRETDLESYVTTYLEEEVRAEAIVRSLGSFARFLEYAASESGHGINFRKLSQQIGVSHTTIASYYQILEDCLIIERVESISTSKTRKKLTRTDKYLFFDLGVRRIAAKEGVNPTKETLGHLFEQFIGLELIRSARLSEQRTQVKFWRDPSGPEVDWVVEKEEIWTPIEVKLTQNPTSKDVRHLHTFLSEYENSKEGFLVCQIPRKVKLADRIYAIPWQEVGISLL